MINELILLAITRQHVYIQVRNLLRLEYMPDEDVANAVDFCYDYFKEHNTVPTTAEYEIAGFKIPNGKDITDTFIISAIYKYIRNQKLEEFIHVKAKEHTANILDGDQALHELHKIIQDTAEVDIGALLHKNVEEHVKSALAFIDRPRIKAGIEGVDKRIGGGIGKQEVMFYAAPPGRGKTTFLLNVFYNGLLQGWNGLFLSLELSENSIKERLFRRMIYGTRKELKELDKSVNTIEKFFRITGSKALLKYERPNIITIDMLNEIIYKAQAIEDIKFDFICIDYVDKLAPTSSMKRFEVRHQIREMVNDLHNLAVENNIAVASATQANRDSVRSGRVTEIGIAESYAKVEAADIILAQNMPALIEEGTESGADEVVADDNYEPETSRIRVLNRVINILKNRDHPIYDGDIPVFLISDMMLISDNYNILPLEVFE